MYGALALRDFVKLALPALLFHKGVESLPSDNGRIGINFRKCWNGPPRTSDLQHAHRISVFHKLSHIRSSHISKQRARSLGDLLESEKFQRRWFQAIICSLDAMNRYFTGALAREEFKVAVVVGRADLVDAR